MNLLTTLLISIIFAAPAFSSEKPVADKASASCKDFQFQLKDESGDLDPSVVNVVMDCHDASGHWPETTTINIISFGSEGMCSSTVTCGNIDAWMIDFEVGGSWQYGSNFDSFQGMLFSTDLTDDGVKATVQLRKVDINRFCSEKTKRVCM